jgi:hypothetical protein
MQKHETCSAGGCGRVSAAALDVRPLCREHFIASCYSNLDEYGRLLEESRYRDTTTELVRRFLSDCTRNAADLAQSARDLDNLERARILDILLRAGELSRQLRRSPRKVATIPIRLSSDKLGQSWEELTITRVISRFGAAVDCSHPVDSGDALLLERQDRPEKVRARVAWVQPKEGDGRSEIGLEFLQSENFWDIDWTTADVNLWQEPGSPSPSGRVA